MNKIIDKILGAKSWWLILLLAAIALNYAASLVHGRFDLTAEKRYTLSRATKTMLGKIDDKLTVEVFLKGNNKSGFRKLANSTEELLQEFKEYSKGRLQFSFTNPLDNESDTAKLDTLYRMGLQPYTQVAQSKEGDETSQRTVLPGAMLRYKNKVEVVNFLKGVQTPDELTLFNNAEALLEYQFAAAIERMTRTDTFAVAYAVGHGELFNVRAGHAMAILGSNYRTDTFNIHTQPFIPNEYKALVVMKPTQGFSDQDKLKIDQYLVKGGRVLMMVDNLYDSMDSLFKTGKYLAYDRGLNLEDLLFKCGVRINQDLVQDMQSAQIPLVVGMQGDKPQVEMLEWPYFPLLSGGNHPITKNLDPVLSQFPNSMDTVKATGIRKTILLTSSENARVLGAPAEVSVNNARELAGSRAYNRSRIPVAVLLEGKFNSLYANRITTTTIDSLARLYQHPFEAMGKEEGRMIVIADGDIATNGVGEDGRPTPMGFDKYINYQFANETFYTNSLDYLIHNSGILDTRSKDLTQRLLDPKKTERNRGFWQILNIGLPLVLVLLFGFLYQSFRRKKYLGKW
jgi:ABC-2 type transport system permease protein